MEYRIRCKNGEYLWVEGRGVKELDMEGNPVRLAGSHSDISERKQAEEMIRKHQRSLEDTITQRTRELEQANRTLERLAKLDPLTELANRRCLDETLEQEIARSKRNGAPPTINLIRFSSPLFLRSALTALGPFSPVAVCTIIAETPITGHF